MFYYTFYSGNGIRINPQQMKLSYCRGNWAIAIIVMAILILCANVLHNIKTPYFWPSISDRKCM